MVEDSLYDIHADVKASSGFDQNYLYMNVFRAMVSTPYIGDPILDTMTTKPKGQVYWRNYTFNPSVTGVNATHIVNPAHCRVIAYVNNPGIGNDYRVLQSAQCRLIP